MNREAINHIKYAYDTVIIANDCNELQRLMQNIHTSQEYGLELNTTKTKCMLISRTQQPPMQLTLNNQILEEVDTYTYLETRVNTIGLVNKNKITTNRKSAKLVQQYEKVVYKQNLNGTKIKTGQVLCLSGPILRSRGMDHNGSHLEETGIL